ncbi:LytTR family DNA-binding domain-containing protein [Abyssalbus ytuae]|uniref:LytTR family transcriptional regulator n=1 Tax=Abyssalbus ytuae TaxID=2926907 RepID=A0A9E6ZX42_9FLAO|nr:LytTR family DNA-binding domain-containing protein [Abyssalbus ytuae]UOB16762.1 LytTR family transcriptional regulator [Abyssalbus ytuae]
MKKVSEFLSQPYPFYYEGKDLWRIIGVIFLMALGFNYFFEPFNVYVPEHKIHYFWISVIHSMTPVFVFLSAGLFFKLNKKIPDQWTIEYEFKTFAVVLFITGIVQFLIRDIIYDNPENWSWKYLFEEVRNTFMVGFLFVLIIIPLNLNYQYSKNLKKAHKLSFHLNLKDSKSQNPVISIETKLKGDDFSLNPKTFLFAKSDGNYIEIYLKNETSEIEKLVKRITIKELASQLHLFPFIMKTHRSYMVNLNEVENVTGNAQGYKLTIKNYKDTVPVSRNLIGQFERKIQQLL